MILAAYTVPDFIRIFKVGRTTLYEEIASGRLSTYKVGRRRYISAHAAEAWQKRLEEETGVAPIDPASESDDPTEA